MIGVWALFQGGLKTDHRMNPCAPSKFGARRCSLGNQMPEAGILAIQMASQSVKSWFISLAGNRAAKTDLVYMANREASDVR